MNICTLYYICRILSEYGQKLHLTSNYKYFINIFYLLVNETFSNVKILICLLASYNIII